MGNLSTLGRIFYGIAIGAMGFLTIYHKDFPYFMIPPGHGWISGHAAMVDLCGGLLLLAGAAITLGKKVFLVSTLLGAILLAIFCFYFVPYELMASSRYMHYGQWENAVKELALAGGAFTIADQHSRKGMSWGATIYALTILSFSIDHFLYARQAVNYMPSWVSNPLFWLYFTGACLMGSSLAILFRFKRPLAAVLLGSMIFIWVIILHLPKVVAAYGVADGGGETASGFLALGYCGIAFVIAGAKANATKSRPRYAIQRLFAS